MRAVITVIGNDSVGILAKVASVCADANANVTEVTQSILQGTFAMIMMVDCSKAYIPFCELSDRLSRLGNETGLKIHIMNEEIFNCMHRI